MSALLRRVAIAPIALLQALHLARHSAALQVRARVLDLRRAGDTGYGILRGLVLGGWRLLRCNPFSHGGFDPVEDQRLFRKRPSTDPASLADRR